MSKNDKDKNRPNRFGNNPNDKRFQMYDVTTERQYTMKIAQARKLLNERKFGEAIKLLDPIKDKFLGRGEFLDILGACYASADYLYEAREIFTLALETPPIHKYREALNKYNLVRLCALTGSPFMAYQYSQQIDPKIVAEAIHRPSEAARCRALIMAVKAGVAISAKEAKMPFDEYVTFSLLLDKGRLEMNGPDVDLDEAIISFTEASRLNPTSSTPFNNLAIIYLWQGRLEEAVEKIRYLLEKIEPDNVHGLSNMVRLLCSLNRQEEARGYLKRLLAIKVKPSDELVKVAEALLYFNQDQAVYDCLQPLNHDENLFSVLQIVDKAAAEQTLIFEIAAAANAGKRSRALELAWTSYGRFETHQILLDRTYNALKNDESGPQPGGRFFYWEPKLLYPQATHDYLEVEPNLLKLSTPDEEAEGEAQSQSDFYEKSLRPFIAKYGPVALDYLAYYYWTNEEPAILKAILTHTLAAGQTDLVKRWAFERVGDEKQRLTAWTALVEANLVGRDEPMNFWLDRQNQTISLSELEQRRAEQDKS